METRFTTTIALLASAALAACGGKSSPGTLPVNAPAMGSATAGTGAAGSAGSATTPAAAGSATPADPCAGG
jgi:hypothetical protein